MIISVRPLEGGAQVMALCKLLLGNSSQWLSQICFAGMSWLEFKDLFLPRYEGIEPPSAVLLNILNGRPVLVSICQQAGDVTADEVERNEPRGDSCFFSVGHHVPNRSQAAKFRFHYKHKN